MKQFCDEANCLHVWLYLYSQNGLLSQTCELNLALALETIPSHVLLPIPPPNFARTIELGTLTCGRYCARLCSRNCW